MFKKNKPHAEYCLLIDGGIVEVNTHAYNYINKLTKKVEDLEFENLKLKRELECIKPVLETPDLKPAISSLCRDCEFVVKSNWNGDILGCRKGIVCDNFKERKDYD